MSATEIRQPLDELYAALDQLAAACDRNDVERIRKIFVEQQTAYQSNSDIVDQYWADDQVLAELPEKPTAALPRLALVRS